MQLDCSSPQDSLLGHGFRRDTRAGEEGQGQRVRGGSSKDGAAAGSTLLRAHQALSSVLQEVLEAAPAGR